MSRFDKMDTPTVVAVTVFMALIAWALYSVVALVFKWAWNLALVPMLGLPVIGFWQAFGFVILLSVVGSFFKGSSKK